MSHELDIWKCASCHSLLYQLTFKSPSRPLWCQGFIALLPSPCDSERTRCHLVAAAGKPCTADSQNMCEAGNFVLHPSC